MRLQELFSYAQNLIILGILLIVILAIIFSFCYFILYKKIGKGTKSLNIKSCILTGITIGYIFFLLGAVFLKRGNSYERQPIHLTPFRAYREAWYRFSLREWRNIIINILLFLPLGFLLPIFNEKLRNIYKVFLIGLGLTISIEILQVLTHRGIFEIDDIINNTLGTIIGYGFIMFFYSIKGGKRKAISIAYLFPLLLTIGLFVGIFTCYHMKELGNLSSTYLTPVNMKEVQLTLDTTLSRDVDIAPIYKTPYGNKTEAIAFANDFFKTFGTMIDENRTDVYQDSILFYSKEQSLHLWLNYAGFTYDFTDFSQFDEGQNTAQISEEDLRAVLTNTYNINIPEEADFIETEEGNYSFAITHLEKDNALWNGTITCSYYEDGTIKFIGDRLMQFEHYRDASLISQEEAFEKVRAGKFNSNLYQEELESLLVQDIQLSYKLDSKGYYQPIYVFVVLLNTQEDSIVISALK